MMSVCTFSAALFAMLLGLYIVHVYVVDVFVDVFLFLFVGLFLFHHY